MTEELLALMEQPLQGHQTSESASPFHVDDDFQTNRHEEVAETFFRLRLFLFVRGNHDSGVDQDQLTNEYAALPPLP